MAAINPESIASYLLSNEALRTMIEHPDDLERPVDIRTQSWVVWLRDGGRPGTSSYVGPLSAPRITAAATAFDMLTLRDVSRRGADAEIDRSTLVELAQAAARGNERRCVTLWVATMMWAGGTVDTRAPWRTAQGLASDDLGHVLVAAHKKVRAGDLGAAYSTISTIHGTGESTFTKWLWAAALGVAPTEQQPLILDTAVRTSLRAAGQSPEHTAHGYVDYVGAMHVATELLRDAGLKNATPERLEWTLSRAAT